MKLLVYGINFAPELTGIGKYTGEMVAWLTSRGHEVRVITAPPYYPEWKVREGYTNKRYVRETWSGAEIFRTPLWVPEKVTGLRRLLHLASFAAASIPTLLAQWRWKPDVIWMTEPPLFCAPAALAFAGLRSSKAWLHIQDYEVDAAFELGMLKGQRLRNFITSIERALLGRFDRVSTISQRMLERAASKGVAPSRLVSFTNWADVDAIRPLNVPSTYRTELGIADDAVVALYSGNMGGKQGLELLADMAVMLRDEPNIAFVFCGGGSGRDALMAKCANLRNVRFIDLQPVERLGDLLGLADVHLLPQRADAADLVMPSKLTGMLSSGRPVLAGARPETELGRVVATCGVVVPPEDAAAFTSAMRSLASQPELRRALGRKAREVAEASFARDAVLGRFERDLLACIAQSTS